MKITILQALNEKQHLYELIQKKIKKLRIHKLVEAQERDDVFVHSSLEAYHEIQQMLHAYRIWTRTIFESDVQTMIETPYGAISVAMALKFLDLGKKDSLEEQLETAMFLEYYDFLELMELKRAQGQSVSLVRSLSVEEQESKRIVWMNSLRTLIQLSNAQTFIEIHETFLY